MTEILRSEATGTVNNVLYQAENSLLSEARSEAFSAKGKVSTSADGGKFSGTVDGKSQHFDTSLSMKEQGLNWDLSVYDKSNSTYSQGDVKQLQTQHNMSIPSVGIAAIGAPILPVVYEVPSSYNTSITNANGDVRNYDGKCVTYTDVERPAAKICATTVTDSDGKLLYTLNEMQTANQGSADYAAVMSDPNGKKLGFIKGHLQGNPTDAEIDVTATKL